MIQAMGHQVATVCDEGGGGPAKSRDLLSKIAIDNGFTHLLFIDADVIWTPQQVEALIKADKPIVGGVYPLRDYPIRVNFNPLTEDLEHFMNGKTAEALRDFIKHKNPSDRLIKVRQLATGFLMIETKVFDSLKDKAETYHIVNAMDYKPYERKEFFPFRLMPPREDGLRLHQTEDWAFCNMARDAGFDIWFHADCIVDHVGTHIFSARLPQ